MTYRGVSLVCMALVTGIATAPEPANACTPPPDEEPPFIDPCDGSARWSEISVRNGARLSTDGVVVVSGTPLGISVPDEMRRERITVELRDSAGALYPGTTEVGPEDAWPSIFVWRPDEALPASEDFTIVARFDNAGIDELPQCAPDELTAEHQLTIVEAQGSVPSPQIVVQEEIEFFASLSDPVCCDGGMIERDDHCWPTRYFDEGFCVGRDGRWRSVWTFEASLDVPDGEGPFLFYMRLDGSKYDAALVGSGAPPVREYSSLEPNVVDGVFVDLRDGTSYDTATAEVGLDVPPFDGTPLPHPDLAGELEQHCEGEPYVCEDTGEGWDPDACTAWEGDVDDSDDEPPGDDSEGDSEDVFPDGEEDEPDEEAAGQSSGDVSCRVAPDTPAPVALFTLALIGLRRRRR